MRQQVCCCELLLGCESVCALGRVEEWACRCWAGLARTADLTLSAGQVFSSVHLGLTMALAMACSNRYQHGLRC